MTTPTSDEPSPSPQNVIVLRRQSRALCRRAVVLRSRGLCLRAELLQGVARALCAAFVRRARHSAYLRSLALRGASEAPQDGAAPALAFCRTCGLAFKPGEPILSCQTTTTHVDCGPPRAAKLPLADKCTTKRRVDRDIIVVRDTVSGRGVMLAVRKTMVKVKTQEGLSVWLLESMEVTTRDGQVVERLASGVYRLDGRTYRSGVAEAS